MPETVLEKRMYTAVATATAGREGRVKSDDGQKIKSGPVSITAHVTLGQAAGAFGLAVELEASIPELPPEQAEALVRAAHQVCPYSNATRSNIVVELRVT